MKNRRIVAVAFIVASVMTSSLGVVVAAPAQAGPTTPPFTQCPAVGLDTSCAILIVFNADGSTSILADPSQGPYDGIEDTLVGVQNNSGAPVSNIQLTSTKDIFGFDGDGLCTVTPRPATCPFGPTGYEGPNTTFTVANVFKGTVNFTGSLPSGSSTYFSLEEALSATDLTVGPGDTCPPDLVATITGTPGNDSIVGTPGNDVIFGLAGDDRIDGGGGNDVICGGPGSDRLNGNGGSDTIYGDDGNDNIFGNEDNDKLFGGPGNDFISGGEGNDELNAGAGYDTLSGDNGTDKLTDKDGTGGDRLDGGLGTDTCTADPNDGIVNCNP